MVGVALLRLRLSLLNQPLVKLRIYCLGDVHDLLSTDLVMC